MKNVSHKKIWRTGAVQINVDPPPIPRIKIKNDMKAGKYCVKIKLRRDPTSEKSDLYEFKMALFDNGNPEEFLLLVQNFKIMLKALGSITARSKLQYMCKLLRVEAPHQFDTICVQMGSTNKKYLHCIISGLGTYIFPVNELSK